MYGGRAAEKYGASCWRHEWLLGEMLARSLAAVDSSFKIQEERTSVKIKSVWFRLMALLAVLLPAIMLFAQEEEGSGASGPNNAAALALAGGMMLVMFIFMAVIYIYMALALQTIAKKTNTENAWLAWIPIINVILMLNIAKKPLWWIILFFIPLVNIIIGIIVWMGIAEARNKPNWWGILMIVPIVGIIVPGYLAWSE